MVIDKIFAFIAKDGEAEGVAAFLGPDGMWLPMVGADMERMISLREKAQEIADVSGQEITLAEFSVRENLDRILPRRAKREE